MHSFTENPLGIFLSLKYRMDFMPENAQEFLCVICKQQCSDAKNFREHLMVHRTYLEQKKGEKSQEYNCKECNFKCSKRSNWTSHLTTAKHKNRTFSNEKNAEPRQTHKCSHCDKEYKAKNSLWYHMKKCTKVPNTNTITIAALPMQSNSVVSMNMSSKSVSCVPHVPHVPVEDIIKTVDNQQKSIELIADLLKQNKELHEQIIEISKEPKVINNITNNHITNSNNNNTNNQFNMNMFLNEDCKNALNIMDFVRSLNLTVQDIEETGRLGYVGGITRIFVNALKDMDVKMRPIHCTDLKRETVYVKDEDTWEKDNTEKNKLKSALKHVARKNLLMLPEWQEQNPDFSILDTPENQQFMQISLSSLGAYSAEDTQKQEDKILKNVLKEVVLDKKHT